MVVVMAAMPAERIELVELVLTNFPGLEPQDVETAKAEEVAADTHRQQLKQHVLAS